MWTEFRPICASSPTLVLNGPSWSFLVPAAPLNGALSDAAGDGMDAKGPILEDERACAAFFEPLLDWSAGECVVAVHLDGRGRVLGTSSASGTRPDKIDLPIRQIVGDALRHDACALILAHTHPGGDPTPSSDDVEATRMLDQALRALGIRLYDHLIFTPGGDRSSFRRLGWL